MKSWKTTLGGIGMIASSVAILIKMFVANHFDPDQVSAAFVGISGGLGLIAARDNKVTSESLGLAPGQVNTVTTTKP